MKVKALVPNLGFHKNQAGEIVEIEDLTQEQAEELAENGFIELVTEKKQTPKKTTAKKPATKE